MTDAEYKTKHDFMSKYELLKETETKWAKLDAIVGSCFVIDCSRAEFRDRLKRKMLPTTGKVFFHRDSFASSFYEGFLLTNVASKKEKQVVFVKPIKNVYL